MIKFEIDEETGMLKTPDEWRQGHEPDVVEKWAFLNAEELEQILQAVKKTQDKIHAIHSQPKVSEETK